MAPAERPGVTWTLAAALVVGVAVVYAPVAHFAFVNFDDPAYVLESPVRHGLTLAGIRWAFVARYAANWHPLTWLSHMLDVTLFGLDPGAPHVVNVVLHALNAVVLLVVLTTATGAPGRSAFVAALFALHPLHVESVAWVAERKDVLSTLFAFGALAAYVRRAPLGVVLVCYTLGLLAKPMVITLPALLLLLDRWPLGREEPLRRLVREKLPFLVPALASAVVTIAAQRTGGAMVDLGAVSVGARLETAVAGYARYLGLALWPAHLAVLYPYRVPDVAAVSGGALVLTVATALALGLGRARPYVAVGWLWFLVTLLPVIGLLQVGRQAYADRYTYVPLVGLGIVVAWGVPDLLGRRVPVRALGVGAAALAAVAGVAAAAQVRVWRDSETLFRHALAVTTDNYLAHNNLGEALAQQGRFAEAADEYAEAARLNPLYAEARCNLGHVAVRAGRYDEAERDYREALRLRPGLASAWNGLGVTLVSTGDAPGAIAAYEEALRTRPEYVEARVNLANALVRAGRVDAALAAYRAVMHDDPDDAVAPYGLGNALAARGDTAGAIDAYRVALRVRPGWTDARQNLAIALAGAGRLDEAERELRVALATAPDAAGLHLTLGLLLAGEGRRAEAIEEYRAALRARPGWHDAEAALAAASP